jgi:hypothetical protein
MLPETLLILLWGCGGPQTPQAVQQCPSRTGENAHFVELTYTCAQVLLEAPFGLPQDGPTPTLSYAGTEDVRSVTADYEWRNLGRVVITIEIAAERSVPDVLTREPDREIQTEDATLYLADSTVQGRLLWWNAGRLRYEIWMVNGTADSDEDLAAIAMKTKAAAVSNAAASPEVP